MKHNYSNPNHFTQLMPQSWMAWTVNTMNKLIVSHIFHTITWFDQILHAIGVSMPMYSMWFHSNEFIQIYSSSNVLEIEIEISYTFEPAKNGCEKRRGDFRKWDQRLSVGQIICGNDSWIFRKYFIAWLQVFGSTRSIDLRKVSFTNFIRISFEIYMLPFIFVLRQNIVVFCIVDRNGFYRLHISDGARWILIETSVHIIEKC